MPCFPGDEIEHIALPPFLDESECKRPAMSADGDERVFSRKFDGT
jgi:hypothetical protein